MLSEDNFKAQLDDLKQQYRDDNAWVGKWNPGSWNDDEMMEEYIEAAWNLYAATATNKLKMTILGGTAIRMNIQLIKNFGVTGANGIQDRVTGRIVQNERQTRALRARFPKDGAGVLNPRFLERSANTPELRQERDQLKQQTAARLASPVTLGGSILSEQNWTPILNDALILGGITSGQIFRLGLIPEEQAAWRKLFATYSNKAQQGVINRHGRSQMCDDTWKQFFNSNRSIFFEPWGPRVFTRELLGLSFFGYKPKFSWHELYFIPDRAGMPDPTPQRYLEGLREVQFEARPRRPANESKIMRAISKFLFGNELALGSPWQG
ncbi:hypothetical protein [Tautonia marina]|uniref:hypothetical protein n=1 Tax=Tautonia marina TaxID=2653855 RepID=UPI001261124E|nr:hypothetical protein [Tautonia marina]